MKPDSSPFRCLGLGFVLFMVIVHLWLTVFDIKKMWPLSPYNMFNKREALIQSRFKAILTTKSGKEVIVSPFHLFPVEYFKSFRIVERTLDLPVMRQNDFYRMVLRRINHSPQVGFDEISASPRTREDDPFVKLKLLRVQYNLNEFQGRESLKPQKQEVILSLGDIYK